MNKQTQSIKLPARPPSALPVSAGIGLKPEHFTPLLETRPALGFVEVHAENYMVAGGPFHHYLQQIHEHYALSVHGVGLSIGGSEPLDEAHLDRLKTLIERHRPERFSEHLAWSSHAGHFMNDLLPLPYTRERLQRVCDHVDRVQERLGLQMLLENPATYVQFSASTYAEPEFIGEVIRRTGCGLLLDVNNVYVSAINHGFSSQAYISALPCNRVGEIHLAGFARDSDAQGAPLLIDSHDAPVADEVWRLYDYALQQTGAVATLLERDANLPPLTTLVAEAQRAAERLRMTSLEVAS
ncbi:MNIO family bufferin maturase [Marinobacterium sp. YM272]|uniref:MNIO family bufferin maturase n=1 Tax=Marinobacterium sp. YM272 TaxID=3421654 RepID=UPI003D7FDA58